MERLIVLDTETTGIEPSEGHRVIEIGCVEITNREITESQYHQYVKPGISVGESVRIHGITDSFLSDKPKFEEVALEFLEYIDGATLVIHNAPFDLGFLNNELALMNTEQRIEDNCSIIDSLELSKRQRPGMMHNLDALCRRFEIDASSRTVHGALLDAQILAQVYLAMTGGQSTLFIEANINNENNNGNDIIRVDSNRPEINIVKATSKELKEHNNYFANS